ncbi:MAG: hypothetical protein Q6370_014485 [Candidatus Sigynarchaeota archaeon]
MDAEDAEEMMFSSLKAQIVSVELGVNDKGVPELRFEFEITEGPRAGQIFRTKAKLDVNEGDVREGDVREPAR